MNMDKCPKCNSEEIWANDGEFDRDRMELLTEWQCANCGNLWSVIEGVDDYQLDYDELGLFRGVKDKTRPEDI
jgi:transcriptional regulator NrdR family protein